MKALTSESGLDDAHAGRLGWLEKTGARTSEAQLELEILHFLRAGRCSDSKREEIPHI